MSVRRINSGDSRVPCDTWNWNVTLRSLLHHFNFYSISQITKIQIAAKTKSLAASAVRTLNSLASHVTRSKRIAFFFFSVFIQNISGPTGNAGNPSTLKITDRHLEPNLQIWNHFFFFKKTFNDSRCHLVADNDFTPKILQFQPNFFQN